MDDATALTRAIIADPADDTARLVFADYCQENGLEERADLIRLQVELARRKVTKKDEEKSERALKRMMMGRGIRFRSDSTAALLARLCLIRRKPQSYRSPPCCTPALPVPRSGWRRGFLEEIDNDWGWWHSNGSALCAVFPIQHVLIRGEIPVSILRFTHGDFDGWLEHCWPGVTFEYSEETHAEIGVLQRAREAEERYRDELGREAIARRTRSA